MASKEVHLANTSDLRDGEMKEITVDERRILLARVGDNFHAVSATCPHYGAPLAEGVLCGSASRVRGTTLSSTSATAICKIRPRSTRSFPTTCASKVNGSC
jgi:nitrite reductase/ring-hydroxylating ferredoxin subunit